jgi:ubiquinone/menaquinone biosynthesis C-methylase UbiE
VRASDRTRSVDQSNRVDWSAYATAYDLMSDNNPAYQALLRDFEAFLETIEKPSLIYDIGGGTGNYTQIAARAFPDSEIRFVEPDTGMLGLTKAKTAAHGNISYDARPFDEIELPGTADLVICVHALYAMPQQAERLRDLRRLLRPGGLLYLVDLGRPMNVPDWSRYMFSEIRKEHGLAGALRVFWKGREVAKQNKAILDAQKKCIYWMHREGELASAAAEAGFTILRQQTVYRGYSDLLVCRAARQS